MLFEEALRKIMCTKYGTRGLSGPPPTSKWRFCKNETLVFTCPPAPPKGHKINPMGIPLGSRWHLKLANCLPKTQSKNQQKSNANLNASMPQSNVWVFLRIQMPLSFQLGSRWRKSTQHNKKWTPKQTNMQHRRRNNNHSGSLVITGEQIKRYG